MILAAILATTIFPGRFVELPMPTATSINVAIVVPLPAFGARDRAVTRVLGRALLEGTDEFTKNHIRELTHGSGQSVSCSVMPDHIRIQFGFAPQDFASGLIVAKSMIEEATLSDDAVKAAIESLSYAKTSYWTRALLPEAADYDGIKSFDVRLLYYQLFKPERLSIAVSGPFQPDQARDYWVKLYEDWHQKSVRRLVPGVGAEKGLIQASDPVTTIELAGPEFTGSDPKLPAKLLAIYALGAGKDSALWRVVRERLRMSYRQEAFLWPTADGFRARIVIAVKPSDQEGTFAQAAQSALLEDVASWTDANRSRASALAQSVYLRGLPLNPLQLQANGVIGVSQADRTFMTAYWPLKTTKFWSEKDLVKSLQDVSLDDMRDAATDILKSSLPRVISGMNVR